MKSTEKLAPIFHPKWSSFDDHALLMAREEGLNFSAVAARLKRSRLEVEQRWHRLRAIKNIVALLQDFGLSTTPYDLNVGPRNG